MRFGFQTVLWSPKDDLRQAFPLIRRAGFTGVELAQAPSVLGPFDKLIARLDENDLQLVGLAGGSIEQRMDYMPSKFRHHDEQPYLYIEDWNAENEAACRIATGEKYLLALHPHYPGPATRLAYSWELLKRHKDLKWLPDTGHLYINWADLSEAITSHPDRLVALHLKDWTPLFGRATYCVAKGFIELGEGDVLKSIDVWEALETANFGNKWVIAELDYARIDPQTSVWQCASWLAGQKKMSPPPPQVQSFTTDTRTLLDALWATATDTPHVFYKKAAEYLYRELPQSVPLATSIWTNNSSNGSYVLQDVHPSAEKFGDDAFQAGAYFCGRTVLDGSPHWIEIDNLANNHPPEHVQAYRVRGVKHLLSIPVLAAYNKHQVRFVIHYLLTKSDLPEPWGELQETLTNNADIFGHAADLYMTELCLRAGRRTALALDKPESLGTMLSELAALIKQEVNCQGATIFLVDAAETKLRQGGTTGIDWGSLHNQPLLQYYALDDRNFTSQALRERRPFLERRLSKQRDELGFEPAKSWETVRGSSTKTIVCAFVPFFGRRGRLLGVVRCRNKMNAEGAVRAFTEDDLATIEAIFQTAAPLLEMRMASEQRDESTQKLFHEIANPLGAARGAIHSARSDLERNAPLVLTQVLTQPYLADALSWMDLMVRLLKSPLAVLEPRPQPTLLFRDVIIPSVRQIQDQLRERSLSPKAIDYGTEKDFKILPALMIDRNMFQQVFFNLLTNAIKYVGHPSHFDVKIWAERASGGFHIYFRDSGLGIKAGWQKVIFEEGVRGEDAAQSDVQGRGFGLWFVREALAKHKSRIWVSSLKEPTEFTIFIPREIKA